MHFHWNFFCLPEILIFLPVKINMPDSLQSKKINLKITH